MTDTDRWVGAPVHGILDPISYQHMDTTCRCTKCIDIEARAWWLHSYVPTHATLHLVNIKETTNTWAHRISRLDKDQAWSATAWACLTCRNIPRFIIASTNPVNYLSIYPIPIYNVGPSSQPWAGAHRWQVRVAKVPNLKICRKGKATTFGKSIAIRPEGNKRMHKGQWQRKLDVICIYIYNYIYI